MPWNGIPDEAHRTPRWVRFRLGRCEQDPPTPQLDSGKRRLATPRARRPVAGRISSQPAGGCPAAGGISPAPLNGRPAVGGATSNSNRRTRPGTKGYINSAWSGPRCLQRAYVKSAAAAFPLGDLRESESSLRSTRATGIVPPGFYGWKPWKSQITIQSSHTPSLLHSPLQHPTGKLLTGMESALSQTLPAPELHP